MASIPFIYFTLFLIWYWQKYHTIGIGFVAIAWVDISSFFSILADSHDLYGLWGINDYAITPFYAFLYCALWTIILYPITKLDSQDYKLTIQKPQLFRYLCIFICISIAFLMLFGDIRELITNGINLSGAENYDRSHDNSEIYQGRQRYLLWIPTIINVGYPLSIICWFVSISICRQSKLLQWMILLFSMSKMLTGFFTGGRAEMLWWFLTFAMCYAFFRKYLQSHQRKRIRVAFTIGISIITIGFLSITFSRFDASTDYAIDSLLGYAGQSFNNFCAALPYSEFFKFRPERVLPLTTLLVNHTHMDLFDYYELISNEYPIQINVFFTMFPIVIMDAGIFGLIIYLCVYLIIIHHFVLPKTGQQTIDFSSLIMLALVTLFVVQGMFHNPFYNHFNTTYALLSFFLYFIFKYKFITKP